MDLINESEELRKRFSLEEKNKWSIKDFFCKLEKYLQAVLAFESTADDPVQHKSDILKTDKPQNEMVRNFIRNTLIDDQVALFMLYRRLEQEKKKSEPRISPFYAINCFSHYSCKGDSSLISKLLTDKESIDKYVKLYNKMIIGYYTDWAKDHPDNPGYNDMVKEPISFQKMDAK